MIIVSQNRKGFVNFDNIVLIEIQRYEEDIFTLECWIKDNRLELGRYATEERTKEVLQQIIDYYSREDFRDEKMDIEKAKSMIMIRDKSAFYMPKE